MKHISLSITIAIFLTLSALSARGAECEFPVGVVAKGDNGDISEATYSSLAKRVESMLGDNNLVSADVESPFMIVADIIDVSTGVLPGPPRQNTVNGTIMLQLLDVASGTVVSTCTLDGVKGTGNSMQQAFSSALRSLNAKNPKCSAFLAGVSQKIGNYYERQYPVIIARAKSKAMIHDYEEALFLLFSIPECCTGYGDATELAANIYQEYIDTDGMKAYQAARALWISNPNATGASKALSVLLTIPSGSAAGEKAEVLIDEIYNTMKEDKAFETREKYENSLRLEEIKTQAAKEIGIAWGKGQQPVNNNILIK